MGTNLFGQYETKAITRRTVMRRTAMSRRAPVWYLRAGFQGSTLHHVSVQISDLAQAREFYRRVFGCVPRIEKMGPYCCR